MYNRNWKLFTIKKTKKIDMIIYHRTLTLLFAIIFNFLFQIFFVAFKCITLVCCKSPFIQPCLWRNQCVQSLAKEPLLNTLSSRVYLQSRAALPRSLSLRPNRLIRHTLLNESCVRYALTVASQRDLRSYRTNSFDFEIWFSIKRENSEQLFADTREHWLF